MRTPAHAMVNAAVLSPWFDGPALAAVVLGAVLPDLPIFVLYVWERAKGTPVEVIWGERYQRPGWLAVIHGVHSLPLAALVLIAGVVAGAPWLVALALSLMLHDVLDFPVHAVDAHRHFFPFSEWRFVSPLSYWDPSRHASKVTIAECALVIVASAVLFAETHERVVVALGAAYAAGYALVYWRSFLRPAAA